MRRHDEPDWDGGSEPRLLGLILLMGALAWIAAMFFFLT